MAPTGEVLRVSPRQVAHAGLTKAVTALVASLPIDGGDMLGIDVGPDGPVYAALATSTPGTNVVLAVADGGSPSRLAALPTDPLPNGLLLEPARDRLLVTDSFGGTVREIDADAGDASIWLDHPLLAPGSFIGPNGLARPDGVVYVSNLDFGRVVRVPVQSDGSAGTPRSSWRTPRSSARTGSRSRTARSATWR